jgi:hypothetical protein
MAYPPLTLLHWLPCTQRFGGAGYWLDAEGTTLCHCTDRRRAVAIGLTSGDEASVASRSELARACGGRAVATIVATHDVHVHHTGTGRWRTLALPDSVRLTHGAVLDEAALLLVANTAPGSVIAYHLGDLTPAWEQPVPLAASGEVALVTHPDGWHGYLVASSAGDGPTTLPFEQTEEGLRFARQRLEREAAIGVSDDGAALLSFCADNNCFVLREAVGLGKVLTIDAGIEIDGESDELDEAMPTAVDGSAWLWPTLGRRLVLVDVSCGRVVACARREGKQLLLDPVDTQVPPDPKPAIYRSLGAGRFALERGDRLEIWTAREVRSAPPR